MMRQNQLLQNPQQQPNDKQIPNAFNAFNMNSQAQGYTSSNPLSFTYSDSFHHQKAYSLQSNTSSENEVEAQFQNYKKQHQQFFNHDSQLSQVQLQEPFKVQSENYLALSSEWYQSPQLGQKSIRQVLGGSELAMRSEQPRVAFRERQNLHNFDSSQMSDQRLSNGPSYLQVRDFFPLKDESPQQFQIQMNHKSHFDHTFHTNQNFLSQSSGIVEFQASRGTSLPPKTISQDDNFGQYSHSKCTVNMNPQLLSDSFDDFEVMKSQILKQQSNLTSQQNKFLGYEAPSPKTSLYAPYSHTSSQNQLRMRQSSESQVRQQESDYERKSFQARLEGNRETENCFSNQDKLLQGVRVISNQSSCSNTDSNNSQGWHMPQQSQVTFQHNNNNHFTYNYNPSHVQSQDQDHLLKPQLSINSQPGGLGKDLQNEIQRVIEPAGPCFMNFEQESCQTMTEGLKDSFKQSGFTGSRSLTETSEEVQISSRSRQSLPPNASQKRDFSGKDMEKLTTQSHHSSMTQSSMPPLERSVNLAQELREINSAISRSSRRANDSLIAKRDLSLEKRQSEQDAQQIIQQERNAMTTSEWLQFLKIVYLQLNKLENQGNITSNNPTVELDLNSRKVQNMVNRDNLLRLIEFNSQKIPLKSVQELQSQHSAVSYLSYEKVVEILKSLRVMNIVQSHPQFPQGQSFQILMIHWLDIQEEIKTQSIKPKIFSSQESQIPVEATPPQPHSQARVEVIESSYSSQDGNQANQSRVIRLDQVKISENNSGETSVEDIRVTSHQRFESRDNKNIVILDSERSDYNAQREGQLLQQDNEREIASKIVKIVLKDQSILLDLSKVQETMTKSQLILSQAIEKNLEGERPNKLRALSLSEISLSITQKLHDLNHFQGLVILNLSSVGIQSFNVEQVRLPSVQFLNLANNNLSEIFLAKDNFPSLKELIVCQNNFRTAKYFSKLANLRLLDLGDNLVDLYEEVICLAFLESLVILNLNANPICFLINSQGQQCPEFKETMAKLLPRVKVLNPPQPISKLSCFENFKDLAFSIGAQKHTNHISPLLIGNRDSNFCTEGTGMLKVQSQMSSCSKQSLHQQNSCQESENTSYVYSKQVNLDNLLSNTNTNTAIVPAPPKDYVQIRRERERQREDDSQFNGARSEVDKFSNKSSPIKVLYDQNMKASKRTEVIQNSSPISCGQQLYGHSPCLTESKAPKKASPQKVVIAKAQFAQIEAQSNNFIRIGNVERKASHSRERAQRTELREECNVLTQTSESQEGNTFDSNNQPKLEDAQQIPIKNDHQKYFNIFTKDTSSPGKRERSSLQTDCAIAQRNQQAMPQQQQSLVHRTNLIRDLNKSGEEAPQQKPPRYIKIKPTSSTSCGGPVNNSFVDSSNPFSPRLSDQQVGDQNNSKLDQGYQSKCHNSVLLQNSGGGQLSIGRVSENDQTLLSQVAELHQNLMEQNRRSYHQAIRRDMSVKLSSSTAKTTQNIFYPSGQDGNNSLLSQPRIRREQSAYSVSPVLNQRQFSYTQNNNTPSQHAHQLFSSFKMQSSEGRGYSEQIDGDDTQSDMAQYYENSKQLMNVKRIREMPSKELCKIQNVNQGRGTRDRNRVEAESSLSLMKAMMIQKPPDDEEILRSASQNSKIGNRTMRPSFNGLSNSANRRDMRNGSAHRRIDSFATSQKSSALNQTQKYQQNNVSERLSRVGGLARAQGSSLKQKHSDIRNQKQTLTPQVRGRQSNSNQRSNSQARVNSFTHLHSKSPSRVVVNRQDANQVRDVRSNLSQVGGRHNRLVQEEDENQDLEYSNITSLSVVTNRAASRPFGHHKQPSQSSAYTQPIINEDYGNLTSNQFQGQHALQDSSSKTSEYAFSNYQGLVQSQRSGRSQMRNFKKSQMILKNAGNQLRVNSKHADRQRDQVAIQFDPKAQGQSKHSQIMKCLEDFNGGSPKINASELTQNTQDVRPFNIPTDDDSATPSSKNFSNQIRNKSEINAQSYNKHRNDGIFTPYQKLSKPQTQNQMDFDRQLSQASRNAHMSQSERLNQKQTTSDQSNCKSLLHGRSEHKSHQRKLLFEQRDIKEANQESYLENQKLQNAQAQDDRAYYDPEQVQREGQNTPRFSQRMNLQKELRYQGAVELINCKRKKKEQKKQLYNSMLGKSSHNSQTRGQLRSRQASAYSQSRTTTAELSQQQRKSSPNLTQSKLNQSQMMTGQGSGVNASGLLNTSNYSNYQSGDYSGSYQSNERQVNIEVIPGNSHTSNHCNNQPSYYDSTAEQRRSSVGTRINIASSAIIDCDPAYKEGMMSQPAIYKNLQTSQNQIRNYEPQVHRDSSLVDKRYDQRQGVMQLSQTQKQLVGGYLQFNGHSQSRQRQGCANKLSIDLRPQRK